MKNKRMFNFIYVVLKTINFLILLAPSSALVVIASHYSADYLLSSVVIGGCVAFMLFLFDVLKVTKTDSTEPISEEELGVDENFAYYRTRDIDIFFINSHLGTICTLKVERVESRTGIVNFFNDSFGNGKNSWFFIRPLEEMVNFIIEKIFGN